MLPENLQQFESTCDDLNEQRRFRRMSVDISVKVFVPGRPASLGRGHEVSAAGLAVYVPMELPLGIEVSLSFTLPYSRFQFGVAGIVRNRDGFRYGVEFLKLAAAEKAEILRVTDVLALTGEAH